MSLTPGSQLPDDRRLVQVPAQLQGFDLLDTRLILPSRDMDLLVLGQRPPGARPSTITVTARTGRLAGVRSAQRVHAWDLPVVAGCPVALPDGAWAVAKPGDLAPWEPMPEPPVVGAYHVAMMNDWKRIVNEQTKRLIDSGLLERTGRVLIGVVGGELKAGHLDRRLAAKATIVCSPDLKRFEFHTLKLLRDYAPGRDFKAWYIHTKGVSRPGQGDEAPVAGRHVQSASRRVVEEWRDLMEHFIVDRFEHCLRELDSCDACGINLREKNSKKTHFAGNFWWSKSSHIETLPKVDNLNWKDRFAAEKGWVCRSGVHRSFFDMPGDLYRQRFDVGEVKKRFPATETPTTKRSDNMPLHNPACDTGPAMDSRLSLVSCASELYEEMLNDFWLRSVPYDCRPILRVFHEGPVTYAEGSWHRVTERKLDLILERIEKEAEGSIFVFSDVDIQFFGPIADDLRCLAQGYDLLFQHDRGTHYPPVLEWLNSGFMVVRACSASRQVFEKARAYLREKDDPRVDDQGALRFVTADERQARMGLLPTRYWTHGRMGWTPGQALDPPVDILMHHANWLVGNGIKVAQLGVVREIVEGRCRG